MKKSQEELDLALVHAAQDGDAERARVLTESGADANATNEYGATALMVAADNGHVSAVRFLTERGADVNAKTEGEWTALVRAARNGHIDVVRFLIEHGADLKTTEGETALMGAARNDHMDIIRFLIDHDAVVDAKDEYGWTALMRAARNGHAEVARFLIEHDADVDAKMVEGETALILAANNNQVTVVRVLTEHGADVNAKAAEGETALMGAARNGHMEVVCFLAEHGADVNEKTTDGETALMGAAESGHMDIVRFLIEHGVDINAKTTDGWTAVMGAAENGDMDVLNFLIQHGADVDAKMTNGEAALVSAVRNGHIDAVRFLTEHDADVNTKDDSGWTLLMSAAWNGHMDVVRFLIELGADINAKMMEGMTALMLGASNGHADVVRFLIECGADVNAKATNGETALIEIARFGHMDVVRVLIEHGADIDAKDERGETALVQAAAGNHANVVRYLIANGASNSAKSRGGDTAIRIAATYGHQEVARVLAPLEETSQGQLSQRIDRATASPFTHLQVSSKTISPLEIELQQLIDVGNLGGDYRAKWLDADVVVKLFVPDTSTSTFADEVHLWQQLRHPNIIKLYGACEDGILQLFVCEFASNRSLDEYLKSCDPELRTPWKFLYQAALGLEFLHERKIVHGDLRCRNILIGSDGLAKLANFELSVWTQTGAFSNPTPVLKDSMSWQSPERLEGEEASFASDVFSLGMCIIEAVTGSVPGGYGVDYLADDRNWRSDDNRDTDDFEPRWLDSKSLVLVRRMCCHDPGKRTSITSVVYELECLAAKEDARAQGGSGHSATDKTISTIDAFNNGQVMKRWREIEKFFDEHVNFSHLRQEFNDLRELYLRLQIDEHPKMLLLRFESLLVDFHTILKTLVSVEQVRVMQLSATRTTTHSIHAFHRRIEVIWRMLDDPTHTAHEREERWAQQRSHQIEFFVSEVSKTWLLLNNLESAEEHSAFLAFLKHEMETNGSSYSEGQLEVMRKAYDEIKIHVGPEGLTTSTPEWFIPWYELQLDQSSGCLGKGGFGSVHRAKWLDSDVVVKQVESDQSSSCSIVASWMSRSQSTTSAADPSTKAERMETREMFKREADIWFGLSHPHVVRLFGACHVGSPFFVCEYATNGTLVEYLRQHPDELWRLLHEAALGVQYLHERDIVHGDLKGNNIVIGSDKKAKVTDFGLSTSVSASAASSAQITGAWHWVAPECILGKGGRPTFASDVFSLGMCVVEALRVVDSLQRGFDTPASVPLPWGALDNAVVKFQLSRGNLPTRPTGCSDDEWSLVTRMCCHDPAKRLKISTVIDELGDLRSIKSEESLSELKLDNIPVLESKQVPDTLSAMKMLLKKLCGNGMTRFSRKLKKNFLGQVDGRVEIWYLYLSLWQRIELVHAHIVTSQQIGHQDEKLCLLVEDARVCTLKLSGLSHTLQEMTEATLHGYALHRRLDKLVSANSLCETETEWSSFCNWKKAGDLN
jgi:ankyrin repeat protein/serine/threonine protein kinase